MTEFDDGCLGAVEQGWYHLSLLISYYYYKIFITSIVACNNTNLFSYNFRDVQNESRQAKIKV